MEQWKDIKDYEGRYQVSDQGRVKSLLRKKPCIMKVSYCESGYASVKLYQNSQTRFTHRVSRLVAEAFIPNPNNYSDVDHIVNEDKRNNAVSNLQWLPRRVNVQKDQAKKIACVHPVKGTLIAYGTRQAAELTSSVRKSVTKCLKNPYILRTGWTFKLIK